MSIIACIPTHNRNFAERVAWALSPQVDHILIHAGGKCEWSSSLPKNCIVRWGNTSIVMSRNFMSQYAIKNGFDYWICCEDDTTHIQPNHVLDMLEVLDSEQALGAITSISRMLAHASETIASNKPFTIRNSLAMFWITRTKVQAEMGRFANVFFDDIEMGQRMWSQGYMIAHLTDPTKGRHDCSGSNIKAKAGGGVTKQQQSKKRLRECCEYLMQHYGGRGVRIAKPTKVKYGQRGARIYMRYNLEEMIRPVVDRWGTIGYQDRRISF